MSTPLLRLTGIGKSYGGIVALEDVDLAAEAGSIHAILGENGAGKSTLMKILAGAVRVSAGTVEIDGRAVQFRSAADAARAGIACVFQELSLVPHLSVAANVSLADPPLTRFGTIHRRRQRVLAREIFARMGLGGAIDVDADCGSLPLSQRQLVEIAKALVRRPRILILDEATSALAADDVAAMTALVRRLRDAGTLVLFISHRMPEIESLADRASVFRNGRHVETFAVGSRSSAEIVAMMVGRPIAQVFPAKAAAAAGPVRLALEGVRWRTRLRGVDLTVRAGEIVGLGGLDGQGQQEMLDAAAGLLLGFEGRVAASGRVVLIPEDRKTGGLFLAMSVRRNLTAAVLPRLGRRGLIDAGAEAASVAKAVGAFAIKAPDPDAPVERLSGGNQQKVVLAKFLATEPDILLLADPTRGIDVGTKEEIYRLLRSLAQAGMAILLHSTDIDELTGLCDRVCVVSQGRVVADLAGAELSERNILAHAFAVAPTQRRAA